MATISKQMFIGAASTSNTTLYTVPSVTTSVVTEIIATNTSGSSQTFTVNLNGTAVAGTASIPANTTVILDMKVPLTATQTVSGFASATSVNFFVSGVEIA
jgi:hypothetical protein